MKIKVNAGLEVLSQAIEMFGAQVCHKEDGHGFILFNLLRKPNTFESVLNPECKNLYMQLQNVVKGYVPEYKFPTAYGYVIVVKDRKDITTLLCECETEYKVSKII